MENFSQDDQSSKLLANAPLLERIAEDPILRDVKIIAEAWDAAGGYEVGSFSERRWAEWNGRGALRLNSIN
jgi:glycogen operon protein